MKEKALEYLSRDSVLYMAMISPIKTDSAEIIYAGAEGVFIREAESGVYMLAADSFDKGKKLLDEVVRPAHICVYRKDIADYLYDKYGYRKYVKNLQAAYMKAEYVEITSPDLDIQPLTPEHLGFVHEYYCEHLNRDYLKDRLRRGAIYGGYLQGELCGFAGVHADGSAGILKVIEKFRGQGLAPKLYGAVVNILLDRGGTPFSQIEHDNEASIGLHKKLGFEVSAEAVYRLIDLI